MKPSEETLIIFWSQSCFPKARKQQEYHSSSLFSSIISYGLPDYYDYDLLTPLDHIYIGGATPDNNETQS